MKKSIYLLLACFAFISFSCDESSSPVRPWMDLGYEIPYDFGLCDSNFNTESVFWNLKLTFGVDTIIDGIYCQNCYLGDINEDSLRSYAIGRVNGEILFYSVSYFPFHNYLENTCYHKFSKKWKKLYSPNSWSDVDSAVGDSYPYGNYDSIGNPVICYAKTMFYQTVTGKPAGYKVFQIGDNKVSTFASIIENTRVLKIQDTIQFVKTPNDILHPEFFLIDKNEIIEDKILFRFYFNHDIGIVAAFMEHQTPKRDTCYYLKQPGYELID